MVAVRTQAIATIIRNELPRSHMLSLSTCIGADRH
jgi:hypothetical protein